MSEVRLGIDVACRARHRASLADERVSSSGRRGSSARRRLTSSGYGRRSPTKLR